MRYNVDRTNHAMRDFRMEVILNMAAINGIAFKNLRAEMSRKDITIGDVAAALEMNRDTLGRKLSRKAPLYLDEASCFAIFHKDAFCL